MGFDKSARPMGLPGARVGPRANANLTTAVGDLNVDVTFAAATNGVRFGRLVRVKTDGAVVPTTGANGFMGIGVSLSSASSGVNVTIRVRGIVNAVASSNAVARGAWLRGASGASTGVNAGCVRSLTATTLAGTNPSVVGLALTSAAAAAVSTARTVRVILIPAGQIRS